MSFEFETKEQREAWRVIGNLMIKHKDLERRGSQQNYLDMQEAATRFDERGKTCGIELGSKQYAVLCSCTDAVEWSGAFAECSSKGLIFKDGSNWQWQLTDKGREVLANLNAMCKVQK